MNFVRRLLSPISDEEYISRIRRIIAFWDRWKWWVVALFIALMTITIALFSVVIPAFIALAGPFNIPFVWVVFVGGFVLGALFGLMICKGIHGLSMALNPFRTERLLLKILDTEPSEASDELSA